jgi:hypothetical protein
MKNTKNGLTKEEIIEYAIKSIKEVCVLHKIPIADIRKKPQFFIDLYKAGARDILILNGFREEE